MKSFVLFVNPPLMGLGADVTSVELALINANTSSSDVHVVWVACSQAKSSMQIVVEVMGSLLQPTLLNHSVYIPFVVRATA
jgi:hypothetical protein